MKHLFDVEIAVKYGVNAAVLLENIGYWIRQNEANETNYFDGRYWTFNSRRAYRELFPYMSERQIATAFEKLIADGLIITGNYNKVAYDRTLWYALSEKGKCILHFDRMEVAKMSNGNCENVEPIPNINTNINANINAYVATASAAENDQIKVFYGNVMLSENQVTDLIEKMGIDNFDDYVDRLNRYITVNNAKIKNHYEKIWNWYCEDCEYCDVTQREERI